MGNKEIECRFLEIDKNDLVKKLLALGANDLGEKMLEETIIYDKEATWKASNKFIRLRKVGDKIKLSYKEHREHSVDGAYEIGFGVDDFETPELNKVDFDQKQYVVYVLTQGSIDEKRGFLGSIKSKIILKNKVVSLS